MRGENGRGEGGVPQLQQDLSPEFCHVPERARGRGEDQRDSEPLRSRIIGGLHEEERSLLRVPVAGCGQGTFVNAQVPGNSRVGNCQLRPALAESERAEDADDRRPEHAQDQEKGNPP